MTELLMIQQSNDRKIHWRTRR